MYKPITSQNFSSKWASLEILKVRVKCGWMSLLDQIRCTVLGETFCARAMERQLQRVRWAGGCTAPLSTACLTAGYK